ncbi:hypothetical protein ACMFMG_000959 [Clarireedia jacksonii]
MKVSEKQKMSNPPPIPSPTNRYPSGPFRQTDRHSPDPLLSFNKKRRTRGEKQKERESCCNWVFSVVRLTLESDLTHIMDFIFPGGKIEDVLSNYWGLIVPPHVRSWFPQEKSSYI